MAVKLIGAALGEEASALLISNASWKSKVTGKTAEDGAGDEPGVVITVK